MPLVAWVAAAGEERVQAANAAVRAGRANRSILRSSLGLQQRSRQCHAHKHREIHGKLGRSPFRSLYCSHMDCCKNLEPWAEVTAAVKGKGSKAEQAVGVLEQALVAPLAGELCSISSL